jgi:prophage antirepressor-like protein
MHHRSVLDYDDRMIMPFHYGEELVEVAILRGLVGWFRRHGVVEACGRSNRRKVVVTDG